jgi:autotransporter-associated beta strand protein
MRKDLGACTELVLTTSRSSRVPAKPFGTLVSGAMTNGGINGGSLIKVGTGTLTLSGANTYTGGTTVLPGSLQLGNGGASGRSWAMSSTCR